MRKLPGQVATKFPLFGAEGAEKDLISRPDGLQENLEVPREAGFAGLERPEKCHGVKRGFRTVWRGKPAPEKPCREQAIENGEEAGAEGGYAEEFSDKPGFIQRSGAGFC